MSLEGCSIASRSKYAFDPSNPAGSYVMNCSNEYGQSVMLTVVEMVRLFDDLNAVAKVFCSCFMFDAGAKGHNLAGGWKN